MKGRERYKREYGIGSYENQIDRFKIILRAFRVEHISTVYLAVYYAARTIK